MGVRVNLVQLGSLLAALSAVISSAWATLTSLVAGNVFAFCAAVALIIVLVNIVELNDRAQGCFATSLLVAAMLPMLFVWPALLMLVFIPNTDGLVVPISVASVLQILATLGLLVFSEEED